MCSFCSFFIFSFNFSCRSMKSRNTLKLSECSRMLECENVHNIKIIKMSFGFSCLNYNYKDENDLSMKNNTIPNEHSYLAPVKYEENEFVVEITTKSIDSSSEFITYSLDGDHEQISMQMVIYYVSF